MRTSTHGQLFGEDLSLKSRETWSGGREEGDPWEPLHACLPGDGDGLTAQGFQDIADAARGLSPGGSL